VDVLRKEGEKQKFLERKMSLNKEPVNADLPALYLSNNNYS
jgi:hypothetical protein